jgi:hypothetical protein
VIDGSKLPQQRYSFCSAARFGPATQPLACKTMEALGGTANIIAVIDLSARIASLCYQYSVAVKDAKTDIERLQREVNLIKDVLGDVQQLLDGPSKDRLSTSQKLHHSLNGYFLQLNELKKELETGKTRKAMSRVGLRALRWPFKSKELEKIISHLEGYKQTFCLALQVDQV